MKVKYHFVMPSTAEWPTPEDIMLLAAHAQDGACSGWAIAGAQVQDWTPCRKLLQHDIQPSMSTLLQAMTGSGDGMRKHVAPTWHLMSYVQTMTPVLGFKSIPHTWKCYLYCKSGYIPVCELYSISCLLCHNNSLKVLLPNIIEKGTHVRVHCTGGWQVQLCLSAQRLAFCAIFSGDTFRLDL